MNAINLIGRITHDIELKSTTNGKDVMQLQIAVRRDFKNANGDYGSDFFKVTTYANPARYINKYGKKGSLLSIEGRLQRNKYTNKEGVEVIDFCIIANKVSIIDGFKENEVEVGEVECGITEDDLPF